MALITKITTQKDNHERFNVYIDRGKGEEFAFSVDQDVLIKFQLKKGKVIDELDIQQILYEDDVKKAYNTALRFLAHRMRSEKEVADYLRKRGILEPVIREVFHKLREYNYVNDKEFADAYVRTQKNTTAKGPEVIRQELYDKGISEPLIHEALEQFTFEEQLATAGKLYEKAKKQNKKFSSQQWKQHIEQLLRRKGFSWEIIQQVMNEKGNETDEQEEWEALEYHGRKAHRRYEKYEGFMYEQKMKQALYRKGFSMEMIEQFLQRLKEDQD
ncbi:recombination regulator RecX [Bacillus alveayuensis]|jgi:regulatory protein|uniref:recombination regulator RecX n=1 Tax=Aeribacillus alveayuensis TaxID=279215 RepID=UPI0005D11AE2|nr:recombination regulator RecX [Bacillus alveayuensis]